MKTIDLVDSRRDLPQQERYYYPDVQEELGLQRTAVNSRRKAANITAHEDENTREAYFDSEQFEELKKVHEFGERGGKLSNYRGKYHQLVEPDATATANASTLDTALNLDSLPAYHKYDEEMRNAIEEIAMNERLKAYVRFEVYIKLNQTISDKDTIEIMGFKPPRTRFREGCYEFYFYGWSYKPTTDGKLDKQKLWKIIKVDLEAERKAKLEAKQQRKLEQAQKEEEQARQNFDAVKEMMSSD